VSALVFHVDDLSGEPTRELVARHLVGMHASSPAESVFALDVDGLTSPAVTFFSGWRGDHLVAIGALKSLDEENGELKSMRVADTHLGTGAGRAMLQHLIGEARASGMRTLWLETGSTDDRPAALRQRRLHRVRPVRRLPREPLLRLHDADPLSAPRAGALTAVR
jgi:putative acetyltransferase